jgi:hypothetical protein
MRHPVPTLSPLTLVPGPRPARYHPPPWLSSLLRLLWELYDGGVGYIPTRVLLQGVCIQRGNCLAVSQPNKVTSFRTGLRCALRILWQASVASICPAGAQLDMSNAVHYHLGTF